MSGLLNDVDTNQSERIIGGVGVRVAMIEESIQAYGEFMP
jgi:hypothetical protein